MMQNWFKRRSCRGGYLVEMIEMIEMLRRVASSRPSAWLSRMTQQG
jgi:hypothetical protein